MDRSIVARALFGAAVTIALAGTAAGPLAAAPAEEADLRIGAVLPVTGKESKIGGAFKAATEFAVKEVNDAGGLDVGGKKMKIDLAPPRRHVGRGQERPARRAAHGAAEGPRRDRRLRLAARPGAERRPRALRDPVRLGRRRRHEHLRPQQVGLRRRSRPSRTSRRRRWSSSRTSSGQGKLKTPLKIALVWENTEHGKDFQKGVQDFVEGAPEGVLGRPRRELRALRARLQAAPRRASQAAKADLFMCDAHLEDYISMQRTYTQMGLYHQMVTYGARGADEAGAQGPRRRDGLHLRERLVVRPPPLSAGEGLHREVQGGDRQRRRSGTTRARTRPSARSSRPSRRPAP